MNERTFARILICVLVPILVTSACNLPVSPTTQPAPVTPSNSPTATAKPSATPFPSPTLVTVGPAEVVFDWSKDQCANLDIPDLPARAFRDAQGNVSLIAASDTNYRSVGPNLNSVKHDCNVIMKSDLQADPSKYDDHEWLASTYTLDGQTVYALIHNEYHGHEHPGMCPQHDYFPCWDNSITLAISTDGGASFSDALTPPANLVARLPYQYQAGAGPDGYRSPSNIIKGPEDYYYSFFNSITMHTQQQWTCLMRTKDLSDPASWRYWDGNGFNGRFIDPYKNPDAKPNEHTCPALAADAIGAMQESITYNTYLNRYVLVGISADHLNGRDVWGFYYAFSVDLVYWTHRQLLMEVPLPWTVKDAGNDLSFLYPSLLDPDSSSRNFETTDDTAYLYFTRNNRGQGHLDRDLIRVPVQFFPSDAQARGAEVPFQP